MKHQVAIIGGQITPVFWGIKEKDPKVVHILYTKDSRHQIPILKKIFPTKTINSYQVSPFDFEEIKSKVESIIFDNTNNDFELNLTGGTKVMALACQSVFNDLKFNSFYIDQKNRIFDISNNSYYAISSKISIDTFIKLSGHTKYNYNKLSDFSSKEINFAKEIYSISKDKIFNNITSRIRKDVNDASECKHYSFKNEKYEIKWNSPQLYIKLGNKELNINSKRAFSIAFNGFWWELIVADVIKNWKKIYELRLNLELFSKKLEQNVKNEIDIVVNSGHKLIFIECKSGIVKQEDINKIRAVKRLYGGVASKSILVSKYKPREDIIEKCIDLGIDVFYNRELNGLTNKLEQTLSKMEL